MELRHLRYFITVAQEQSFTRAAEKLFTAQPSLSQQIKDLEQEVGVNLFERSSRKIQLTDEGKAFLIYAEKALENAKFAVASARQVAQQKNNQIYIGFLNVAELKVMPHILAKLKKTMLDLKIHLHSLFFLEQLQRLKNAELDLSITRFQLDHPGFGHIHLLTEQIHLVAAKHLHPTDRILKLQELKNHTIIMCDQNASPIFYERLNALMSFDQLKHDQLLWATNVLQHINLINMGMGFSFAPDYLLRFLNDEVKVIQTDRPLPQVELYATFNKNSQNPALNIIAEALNNTVNA